MNQELQKKITDLLGLLEKGMSETGEFLFSQAPGVAQEIVYFHIANSLLWVIFSVIMLYCLYLAFQFEQKKADNNLNPFAVAASFLMLFIFLEFREAVKGIWAPRLVILEYTSNLLTGIKE